MKKACITYRQMKSIYHFKNKVDWNERCETPAGKARQRETPQAQRRRGGSRTARGKRVPGVEINVRIL